LSLTAPRTSGIALALTLVSGFYLGARIGVLGNTWMRASYAALVVMAVAGGPVATPRIRALRRAAEDTSDRTLPVLGTAASDVLLRASLRVRVAFGLAVVYLMVGKPETTESLLVLAVAAALTIASVTRPLRSTVASPVEVASE
jgi:hypothetical protein